MIISMTGYGKAVIEEKGVAVETECRSVNSRFLDISIKLPRLLSDKELELKNLIKDKVKRGKLSISMYITRNGVDNRIASIHEENLQGVVKLLTELQKKAGIDTQITLNNLLEFQNIIFSDDVASNEKEFEAAKKSVIAAIVEMNKMRMKEGEALASDLNDRIQSIIKSVNTIEAMHRTEVTEYFNKMKARAKELLDDLDQYNDRLVMELALLVEKYDITEECIRLKSHIDQFNHALENDDEVGRRLNFLIQELNREANTINSKSISSEVTKHGIMIKEELEKIREQIQNIE